MSARIVNSVCMKCNNTYTRELFSNDPVNTCPQCMRNTMHDLVELKGIGPAYTIREGSRDLILLVLLNIIVYTAAYFLLL